MIAFETLGAIITLHTIGDGAYSSVEVDFDLSKEGSDEVLTVITESVVILSNNSWFECHVVLGSVSVDKSGVITQTDSKVF